MLLERRGERPSNGRATVDERPITIESGEPVHLGPVNSRMAATISSRPAPDWPSIVAARSSAPLLWLNLRVPRIFVGSTSKPMIARVSAWYLPGSIFDRVQGLSG